MTTARPARHRRIAGALVAVALAVSGLGVSGLSAAGAAPVLGPLRAVGPDASLNCVSKSVESDWLAFFRSNTTIPHARSCATLVSVAGVGLFGPPEFGDAGHVGATPLIAFQAISQRVVTPDQTTDGTLRIITKVGLPGTSLGLTQRDVYGGGNTMRTTVILKNVGPSDAQVVVYRTGDCFPGADLGYGMAGGGSVGCEQALQRGANAQPAPGPIFMRWDPTAGTSRFTAGSVTAVRNAIGAGTALANDCDCRAPKDVAAALSWTETIPAAASATVAHTLTLSTSAGRDMSQVEPTVRSIAGSKYLFAKVTSLGVGIAGAAVDFRVGSLTQCAVVANASGTARCPWHGPAPRFVATYIGDAQRRPARATFVPATPPPPLDLTGFPACAHFDRTGFALLTAGDAHHEEIGMTTQAPPCPGVIYRATADGVPVGSMNGDLRTTTFVGDSVAGFASLFIETGFGLTTAGCHKIQSIDSRTREIIDTYPGPGDAPKVCIDEVAGQKFR